MRDLTNTKLKRAERERRIRKMLHDAKMASGCVDCGYREHPAALEFDHVRGVKEFNVGSSKSHSLAAILAEMEKCEVVCSNCHRIRTYLRGQHGSRPD